MSNTKLKHTTVPANATNYQKGRAGKKISKITIHHMAGNLTAAACGKVFQRKNLYASSNYGVDSKGNIGYYVSEPNRSYASSSATNDNVAVTIEVANDGRASKNWHVSDKAIASTINLVVDICKRNGIKQLTYNSKSSGTLTRHNMFAATTCPGPYLQSKFPYIRDQVNKKLKVKPTTTSSKPKTPAKTRKIYGGFTAHYSASLAGKSATAKTAVNARNNPDTNSSIYLLKRKGRRIKLTGYYVDNDGYRWYEYRDIRGKLDYVVINKYGAKSNAYWTIK